tara:strand:- start:2744 stop:2974 length:231 start_codon:yes stop_codon:yes gene_type:complete
MNVYIVIDENQNIEVVCSSKFAVEEYIRANEKLNPELNYIEAQVWSLADVDKAYYNELSINPNESILKQLDKKENV